MVIIKNTSKIGNIKLTVSSPALKEAPYRHQICFKQIISASSYFYQNIANNDIKKY
jgi:hypothetical protein